MHSGWFNCRVEIERDDTVRSGGGGKKAWDTPFTVGYAWARMEQVIFAARESQGSPDFPISRTPVNFTVLQRNDVRVDMRLKWLHGEVTRYFQIRSIKQGPLTEQTMLIETEEVI